jgi:hypothetical protein
LVFHGFAFVELRAGQWPAFYPLLGELFPKSYLLLFTMQIIVFVKNLFHSLWIAITYVGDHFDLLGSACFIGHTHCNFSVRQSIRRMGSELQFFCEYCLSLEYLSLPSK